ncbi:MAG: hypothetical protein ACKVQW_10025 [Pyrinomonadaceae bacterium]
MKVFLFLQVLVLSFFFQSASCTRDNNNPVVKWKGMDDINDLVFLFKKDSTYEQRREFVESVLSRPRTDKKGSDNPEGVIDVMVGRIVGDYDGGVVNFGPTSTAEQREKLKKELHSSPIVFRVYENIVPNRIDDLPDAAPK